MIRKRYWISGDYILTCLGTVILYLAAFYKPVGILTDRLCLCVFMGLITAGLVFGFWFRGFADSCWQDALLDLTIPLGIYTFFSQYGIAAKPAIFTGIAMGAGLALFSILYEFRLYQFWSEERFLAMVLLSVQCWFAFLISVTGAAVTWRNVTDYFALHSEHAGMQTRQYDAAFAVLTDTDSWALLTSEEKLEVLQAVADYETNALGIPFRIKVSSADLSGNMLGCYSKDCRLICIRSDYLESADPAQLVNVVCHECRHGYQHALTNLYDSVPEAYQDLEIFDQAENYRYEFSHYRDSQIDFDQYYKQECEIDARAYAEEETEAFFECLRASLSTGG